MNARSLQRSVLLGGRKRRRNDDSMEMEAAGDDDSVRRGDERTAFIDTRICLQPVIVQLKAKGTEKKKKKKNERTKGRDEQSKGSHLFSARQCIRIRKGRRRDER